MNKERKFFTIMAFMFFLTFGYSQNCFSRDVGGVVSGNVQWSGDIHVIEDVTVSSGSMLTILPGTTVRFSAGREIFFLVQGRLIAEGLKNNMILFTSDANSPSPGDWDLICFDMPSGDSSIKYCVVEYGVDSINTSGDESDSAVIIQNSIIRHSQDDGILIGPSSDMNIQFNTIYKNGAAGVGFHKSLQGFSKNVTLKNNIIVNNVYGIVNDSSKSYSSEYNNVWGNNNGDYITRNGEINQNNDISADPLFEDIFSDNVNLQQHSPCLKASEGGGEIGVYGTCSGNNISEPPVLTVDINGTSVSLTWSAVGNATGYRLLYAPYPDPIYTEVADLGNTTSFSADLWIGAAYYVYLQAYNSYGDSDYSNMEHFVIY